MHLRKGGRKRRDWWENGKDQNFSKRRKWRKLKMEQGGRLWQGIFSCGCRCNSFYFPLGIRIMDCGYGPAWCVWMSFYSRCAHEFIFWCRCLICVCVWVSVSLSPLAKPEFLEGNPTDNDEYWFVCVVWQKEWHHWRWAACLRTGLKPLMCVYSKLAY